MDEHSPYSLEQMQAALGVPIKTRINSILPLHTTHEVKIFACGCEAIPVAGGLFHWERCVLHGRMPTIKISDRRSGMKPLDALDYDSTGLLGELIARQQDAPRDSRGCANVQFSGEIIAEHRGSVLRLVEARILSEVAPDNYVLNFFTCYDAESDEWY
jgi:hypothetical protein